MHMCAIPATRLSRGTVSRTSSISRITPSTNASRNFVTRATSASREESVARNAAAVAIMPATLCVPLRRSRSCPPPTISGSISKPRRCIVMPIPFGPPNLCADTESTSTSFEISRKSCQQVACTASVCNTASGAFARTTLATCRNGEMLPTSLFTAITDTTPTRSLASSLCCASCNTRSSSTTSMTPVASTPTTLPFKFSTQCKTA